MPVYKDEARNTWYAMFYYKDWQGERKKKKKRGFKTQREAKEFEREFLLMHASDPNITFETLVELYFSDAKNRIRWGTAENKESVFDTHITPYFKKKKISEIDVADIRRWQNVMLEKINPHNNKPYSPTYLRTINSQLSAIFNFAVEYYGLPFNPCRKTKSIGEKQADEMSFWTLDEFNTAISYEKKPAFHLAFMLLYWTGMREGECLALSPSKILHDSKALNICHSYHKKDGKDILGPTKTKNSVRVTPLPDFVYEELKYYVEGIYGITPTDRIFYFTKTALNKELDSLCKKSGVKRIRVHDLRHSHVSLLVELGYRSYAIADRIGDTPEMVDKTYAHLYPNKGNQIARELDRHKDGISNGSNIDLYGSKPDTVNVNDMEPKNAE